MDDSNLISGSSAFSKSSLNIWKFSIHILLNPCLENFEHYFASLWDECNCAVDCTFSATALWGWKTGLFQFCSHCWLTLNITSDIMTGCPSGLDCKESSFNVGEPRFNPWVGRSPEEGNGIPLQYSCLENSKDRGTWGAVWVCEELETTALLTLPLRQAVTQVASPDPIPWDSLPYTTHFRWVTCF